MRFTSPALSTCFKRYFLVLSSIAFLIPIPPYTLAQSIDLPVKGYGISVGNSKKFTGIRFNFRDHLVEQINGVNFTLWRARDNKSAVVRGVSIGLMPEAGKLRGVQIGGLGVSGDDISGITIALIGAGSGENMNGIVIGGIGAGAGRNMSGLALGVVGVGAGDDARGIALGGIGVGAGDNFTGIAMGGIGAGSGNHISGIAIGGLGAGCGNDLHGIAIGGLGAGAGNNLSGIAIGGLGAGCGNQLSGIAIGGIGAGAPAVSGISIGGFMSGGNDVTGITLATGWVKIQNEGRLRGFSASAFNQIKGRLNGVSIGILNYARQLKGIQIGLINYVRDNPKYLKVLPIINARF